MGKNRRVKPRSLSRHAEGRMRRPVCVGNQSKINPKSGRIGLGSEAVYPLRAAFDGVREEGLKILFHTSLCSENNI